MRVDCRCAYDVMCVEMKSMAQEVRDKDQQHHQVRDGVGVGRMTQRCDVCTSFPQLLEELNRLPKSINRQVYIRRYEAHRAA